MWELLSTTAGSLTSRWCRCRCIIVSSLSAWKCYHLYCKLILLTPTTPNSYYSAIRKRWIVVRLRHRPTQPHSIFLHNLFFLSLPSQRPLEILSRIGRHFEQFVPFHGGIQYKDIWMRKIARVPTSEFRCIILRHIQNMRHKKKWREDAGVLMATRSDDKNGGKRSDNW